LENPKKHDFLRFLHTFSRTLAYGKRVNNCETGEILRTDMWLAHFKVINSKYGILEFWQ